MAQPTIVLPEGSVDTSVPYTTSPKLTVTELYGLVMERRILPQIYALTQRTVGTKF